MDEFTHRTKVKRGADAGKRSSSVLFSVENGPIHAIARLHLETRKGSGGEEKKEDNLDGHNRRPIDRICRMNET